MTDPGKGGPFSIKAVTVLKPFFSCSPQPLLSIPFRRIVQSLFMTMLILLGINWTLGGKGVKKEIESEQWWKAFLATRVKQSPSEAVVSDCLNYFYSSTLVRALTQASQRGAVCWQGKDAEGLWHPSQLWAVSQLERAAGSHESSTQYCHLSFPSRGKELKGLAFAQLHLPFPRAIPFLKHESYLLAQLCWEKLVTT